MLLNSITGLKRNRSANFHSRVTFRSKPNSDGPVPEFRPRLPLAAPIGSGLGIQNPINIRLIIEAARVPVLVDAGVGTASDAAIAMELGCDGVLMNTAIAEAKDPVMMAKAMRLAVESGRLAYLAGRMKKKMYADPSSPLAGLI